MTSRQGIAATTIYEQIKACLTDCASVLRGQGDGGGARRLAKATTTVYGTTVGFPLRCHF